MGEDVTPSSPALEKMTVDGVSILAGTISSTNLKSFPTSPGLCLLQLHLAGPVSTFSFRAREEEEGREGETSIRQDDSRQAQNDS